MNGSLAENCLKRIEDQEDFCASTLTKPRIDNYLRITIGTDEEMDQLLAFLKKSIREN